MKKKIAIVLAMLMVMPFAFAEVSKGDRISVYDENDASPFHKVFADNSPDYREVTVCTPKDKDLTKTFVFLPDISYLEVAKSLFDRMQGAGGYDHFGCNRVRV